MNIFIDARFSKIAGAKGISRYLQSYLKYSKIKFHFLLQKKIRPLSLLDPFYLSWEIKFKKIDALYLPSINLPLFHGKCKVTLTLHDFISLDFYNKKKHRKLLAHIYYNYFLAWKLKSIHRVIAVSEYTKSQILIRYPKIDANKISVVYPGIDKNIFNPYGKSTNTSRKYFFAMFSHENIIKHKNIQRVIKAFNIISNLFDDYELVILGKASVKTKEDLLQGNKKTSIRFIENLSDAELVACYQSAVAFVYPSLAEGFGIPIVEAMASGCPVITSNLTSMPEVAGSAALLVNPYNYLEIADSMKLMIQDKKIREKLIQEGFSQAEKFSWENTATAIDSILQ